MLIARVIRSLFSIGFFKLVLKYLRKKFGPTYIKWRNIVFPVPDLALASKGMVMVEDKLCTPGTPPRPALVRCAVESLLLYEGH